MLPLSQTVLIFVQKLVLKLYKPSASWSVTAMICNFVWHNKHALLVCLLHVYSFEEHRPLTIVLHRSYWGVTSMQPVFVISSVVGRLHEFLGLPFSFFLVWLWFIFYLRQFLNKCHKSKIASLYVNLFDIDARIVSFNQTSCILHFFFTTSRFYLNDFLRDGMSFVLWTKLNRILF